MQTVYEKIVSIISKPPSQRTDFEALEIVSWFRNKSDLFLSVKPEIVKEVIKQCGFQRCEKDDVVIKQGDSGDKMYIVLKGALAIYHIQDRESNEEILSLVNTTIENNQHGLDRAQLGLKVWTSEEGNAFGEVALIKSDCVRTASVVADCPTDLMVVDRTLYNESVRDALEQEFQLKTGFVENNPLYRSWSARHRKQLAISLRLERYEFGAPLARQGHTANKAYFIQKGEVEVTIHPSLHKSQFPSLWNAMEQKIPILTESSDKSSNGASPHEQLRLRQKAGGRQQEIGLLGENEFIGFAEFLLRLDNYIYTAKCTSSTEVLVLHREQYDRFFEKRYPESIVKFRKEAGLRVDLYLQRIQDAPLLEYMLLLLENSYLLELANKSNEKTLTLNDLSASIAVENKGKTTDRRSSWPNKGDTNYGKLMSQMQSRYTDGTSCEPDHETRGTTLEQLEIRIKKWLATTSVGMGGQKDNGVDKKKRGKGKVSTMKAFQVNNITEAPRPGNKVLVSTGK